MSDTDTDGTPVATLTPVFSACLGREAERNRKAEELRPINKAVLFDAFAAAGIVVVFIAFDGYGDEGQIESVDVRDAQNAAIALPKAEIELVFPSEDGTNAITRTMSIGKAVEELAYDLLRETHPGWENNDGAYGEFVFDVAARTISLDHNDRYTAVDTFSHEW